MAGNAGKQLQTLIDLFWQWKLYESPVLALTAGTGLHANRLHSRSFEAEDARIAKVSEFDRRLQDINQMELSEKEQFHSKLLAAQFRIFLEGSKWKDHSPLNAYNFLDNIIGHFAYFIIPNTSISSVKDCENYFGSLECVPHLIDEQIARSDRAIKNQVTLHAVSIERYTTKLETIIQTSKLPFLGPLASKFDN